MHPGRAEGPAHGHDGSVPRLVRPSPLRPQGHGYPSDDGAAKGDELGCQAEGFADHARFRSAPRRLNPLPIGTGAAL